MPPNCHHGPINMKEVSESVDLELTSLTAQVKSPKSLTMRSSNPGHRLYERGIQKDQLKNQFITEMRAIKLDNESKDLTFTPNITAK